MRGRGIAAGKHRGPQRGHARESLAHAPHKELASPNRPIVAITGAVEGDAKHARVPGAAFGKDGRDVGAVVLNSADFAAWKGQSGQRRAVLRVEVVRDEHVVRIDVVHRHEIGDGLVEGLTALRVIEIADMLTDESLAVDDERDGVLQIRADGEHGPIERDVGDGGWRVTARAAQNDRTEGAGPRNRVVHTPRNRPLADEERVREARQTLVGIRIVVGNGFTRAIRARHDEKARRPDGEQQMVEWACMAASRRARPTPARRPTERSKAEPARARSDARWTGAALQHRASGQRPPGRRRYRGP